MLHSPQNPGNRNCTELEKDSDICLTASCPNNSPCVKENNSYRCRCLPGFAGDECIAVPTIYVRIGRDVMSCGGANCSDNGECLPRINGYSCNCFDGYSGQKCETKLNFTGSAYIPHECGPEYTGIMCDIPLKCMECSENGLCVWNSTSEIHFCECMTGYGGENCDVVATTSYTDHMYATYYTDLLTTTNSWTTTDIVSGVAGVVTAPVVLVAGLMFVTAALTIWRIQRKKGKSLHT